MGVDCVCLPTQRSNASRARARVCVQKICFRRELWGSAISDWNGLRVALLNAQEVTRTKLGRLWRVFWSAHQRFFKQLCISLKVDTIVAEAREALEQGLAVIIGMQTTGEATDVFFTLA